MKSFYECSLHNLYFKNNSDSIIYGILATAKKSYVKNTGTTMATIFSSILKSAFNVSFGLDVMVTSVAVTSVVKFKLIFELSIVINLEEEKKMLHKDLIILEISIYVNPTRYRLRRLFRR